MHAEGDSAYLEAIQQRFQAHLARLEVRLAKTTNFGEITAIEAEMAALRAEYNRRADGADYCLF